MLPHALTQADDLLYVAYSKFYLFRVSFRIQDARCLRQITHGPAVLFPAQEPGEWSLDQGIRVSCFNISKLMASPVSQVGSLA